MLNRFNEWRTRKLIRKLVLRNERLAKQALMDAIENIASSGDPRELEDLCIKMHTHRDIADRVARIVNPRTGNFY